jgi:hypothetical protein
MRLIGFFLVCFLTVPTYASTAEASASSVNSCEVLFSQVSGQLVKVRSSGAKIVRLGDGSYYKETSEFTSFEDQVFNSDRVGVYGYALFSSFHLQRYIAKAEAMGGLDVTIDGKVQHLKAGVVQEGRDDIRTPLDEFRQVSGRKAVSSDQLHTVLNSGDWPRHYANWKLIWSLMRQTDLNIENLGISRNRVFIFDTGDAFNTDEVRSRFGVSTAAQNFDYNFPHRAGDRVRHVPDFRIADENLKQMVRTIAREPLDALRARMGEDFFKTAVRGQGGSPEQIVLSIWKEAKNLASLLDSPPKLTDH